MEKSLMNISSIEQFFYYLLKNKVSGNVFFGNLPPVINEAWKSMILVDVNFNDNGVGQGLVNVFLYARPFKNGEKNTPLLLDMSNKLDGVVSLNKDNHYRISRTYTYSDYDKQRNLHCNIVTYKLTII